MLERDVGGCICVTTVKSIEFYSVIVPTYNMARYLGDALDSVFAQTRQPGEVIVVDDGSTDDTRAIVGRYSDRVRYIHQSNAGVSAARNAGLRAASHEYIALLDADDIWAPDKLAAQIPLLEQDPSIGLVCSDFAIERADGRRVPSYFAAHPWDDHGDVFEGVFSGWSIPPSSVVFRWGAAGEFDESLTVGEDLHLFLRIACSWKVVAVPRVLCTKRERPDGARPFEDAMLGSLRMLDRLETAMPDLSTRRRRLVRRRKGDLELELGRYRTRNGRAAEGRGDLIRAVRDYPLNAKAVAWLAINLSGWSGPRPR